MQLAQLHLEEFRVYRELDVLLAPAGVRIVGPNGSGKSSVLEAITLLSTARSQRSGSDRELIRWGSGDRFGVPPYARCSGIVERADERVTVAVELEAESPAATTDEHTLRLAEGAVRKRCLVDGRSVRAMDLVGRVRSVSFSPEDVAIVSGPPSGRRRLIDIAISQLDRHYLGALSRYGRVLGQRNGLLKSFARDGISPSSTQARSQLPFWDDELIESGAMVVSRRRELIARLSGLAADRYAELAGGATFTVGYQTNVGPLSDVPIHPRISDPDHGNVEADPETVIEFRTRLAERRADEFRRGVTLIGPHRDDLVLSLDGADLSTFGSRGQQRLGILALKLAEADLMVEVGGDVPVLLLDDVLSELDPERGRLLIDTIARYGAQAVITATDEVTLASGALTDLPLLHAGTGTLR